MSDKPAGETAPTPADEPKAEEAAVPAPEPETEVAPAVEAVEPPAEEAAPAPEPESQPEAVAGSGIASLLKADPVADEPAKPKKAKKAKKAEAAEETAPEPAESSTASDASTADGDAPAAEAKPESKKKWYAVKVQSGREDTIKSAILRKVAIEGLEEFFGEIAIPFEEVIEKKPVRVKNKKTGDYEYQEKKVTKRKKKFHGYIFANVEFNDRILYLFRETSGVGDFLNVRGTPGNPIAEPMPDHEVKAMLTGEKVADPNKKVKIKLDFEKGDKVRIREGSFANQVGDVKLIIDAKDPTDAPKITVTVTLWGRPVDVEVEANQVEKV